MKNNMQYAIYFKNIPILSFKIEHICELKG